jgi:hypothetical protein
VCNATERWHFFACSLRAALHRETKLSQRDYETLRLRESNIVVSSFTSLCAKEILNHREHRGAARYTEKPNVPKRIWTLRLRESNIVVSSFFSHSLLFVKKKY